MANKQINELTELTTPTDDDLLIIYDIDESGSEKSKKVSMSDFGVSGTFTPVVSDASSGGNLGSTSGAGGNYIKIGDLVYVNIRLVDINTAGMTGGNTVYIQGLPYTSNHPAEGSVLFQNIVYSGSPVIYSLGSNTDYVRILKNKTGAVPTSTIVSDLTSGSADIFFNITYLNY